MTHAHLQTVQSETLEMPNPRPGWRGGPPAEIRLGQTADGQWASTTAKWLTGIGQGTPLVLGAAIHATRSAALESAVSEILFYLSKVAHIAPSAEIRRMRDWAIAQTKPIAPKKPAPEPQYQQGDLFAF